MKTRIMYIEFKSNQGDKGWARIGRVTLSKTGKTLYYLGKEFQSLKGHGIGANFEDIKTGDQFWISGPKKNGQDRHWAGSGPVIIDEDVQEEYYSKIRTDK